MSEKRHVPDETHAKNLSASKVKSHAQCPLGYWFSYLSDEDRTKPQAGYREKGSAVHEAIEEVLRDNPDTRDAGILSHRFKRTYREKDPQIAENMYEDGLDCCDVAARYIENNREMTFSEFEIRHEYRIESLKKEFTAIMDIVTEDGIVDWKTGSRTDYQGELHDYRIREEKIQGMVYAGAYLNKYGEYPDYVRFVYLGGEELFELNPNKQMWEEMKQYAKAVLESQSTGQFPAKEGGHCGFCDYEFVCPAKDHSMANVSYWKF